MSLADSIRAHWESWSDLGGPVVDRLLFGTDDAGEVAAQVDAWCVTHLGAPVVAARGWITSVGCVALVTLADGRDVAIKVHQPDRSMIFLEGVQAVQRAVIAAGVAAPAPVVAPAPIRDGGPLATADAFLADPGLTDGRAPGAARAAATTLALATRASAGLPADTIAVHPMHTGPGELFPTPHSPIFDFEATAAGAEWIDDLARSARAVLDGADAVGRAPVLVHQDWCSRNVRVVDGAVVAVYDWDSVQRAPIARAAGQAAALWPCTSEDGSPDPSTPDELDAFLADFAVAWGTPFTAADRRVAHASAAYTLAYMARCEHAIGLHEGAGARFLRMG